MNFNQTCCNQQDYKITYKQIILITLIAAVQFCLLFTVGCGSSGGMNEAASINLSSDSQSIPADGKSSAALTAVVSNSADSSVTPYNTVLFKTNLGHFRNGSQEIQVDITGENGTATTSLISTTQPGIAEVTCYSGGVSQSIRINFTHYDNTGLPVAEEFGLSVQYHNISGLWMSGLSTKVYAHLADFLGNGVKDGVPVRFRTYNTGGFFDPDMAVTAGMIGDNIRDNDGVASSTLFSASSPSPAQGMVSVTAETDGGETTHVTSIAVTPGYDAHIMYAGTNGGGVYKSTDSGRTWENISKSTLNPRAGQNWLDPYIKGNSAICVDPDDHNTVYVGTGYLGSGNLFRSLDGGMNWNSNNPEEWFGVYSTQAAVLTVLCDDDGNNNDDNGNTNYVWVGTEGQGIVYATDGKNFSPAGGVINVNTPSGKGEIASAITGYSAKTETWTLKCIVPEATVNSPSIITAIDPVAVENSDYTSPPVFTPADPSKQPATDGRIEKFTTSANTKTETWTAKYVIGATAEYIKAPDGKGTIIDVTSQFTQYREKWTLTCVYVDINQSPLLGQDSTVFTVEGSSVGKLDNAKVNTAYTSDYINFKIIPGPAPFIVGDVIEFETVPLSYWQISGTVSGMQAKIAYTGVAYTSDNQAVGFTIYQGTVPFVIGDTFTFQTYEARPAYWTVAGSLSGMQAGIAQTGEVYTSDNGEITFTINEKGSSFKSGDIITIDVIANKLGHNWTVWDIVKVPGTHNDTAVLYAATGTGLYKSINGGRTWDSTGRFTGDSITALELYHTSSGTDILYAGTQNAGVWVSYDSGITWAQFASGMDRGTNIKDILLDRYNHTLYAAAWYGPIDNAGGKVFVHQVNGDFTMAFGSSWYETNQGLSGEALYAIAADNQDFTSTLYAGGEGISFYRTSGSVATTNPLWEDSSTGFTNTIMSRIPVLFSGEVGLSYKYVQYDNVVFMDIYLQDVNGNPPIAGSTFKVTFNDKEGDEDTTKEYSWTDIVYPDTYSYQGTFRDPANGYTNNPYSYRFIATSGDELKITYMLKCNDEADITSGCSGGGGEETVTIPF
ncbi:MAG: WD40/YVTN/BNR-like repeat-containing protein [Desulfamplus sp.]